MGDTEKAFCKGRNAKRNGEPETAPQSTTDSQTTKLALSVCLFESSLDNKKEKKPSVYNMATSPKLYVKHKCK